MRPPTSNSALQRRCKGRHAVFLRSPRWNKNRISVAVTRRRRRRSSRDGPQIGEMKNDQLIADDWTIRASGPGVLQEFITATDRQIGEFLNHPIQPTERRPQQSCPKNMPPIQSNPGPTWSNPSARVKFYVLLLIRM